MRMIGTILEVWRFIMCRILHLHSLKISRRVLHRSILFDERSRMKRGWILETHRECKRCGFKDRMRKRKGIASNWQDPARLFPDVDFGGAPLQIDGRIVPYAQS